MSKRAYKPTQALRLRPCSDGYWRTSWTDLRGQRHAKAFGKNKTSAHKEFTAFHFRWQRDASIRTPGTGAGMSVREAWEAFEKHARAYYVKQGEETGHADNFELAMREVLARFGDLPLNQFDVGALSRCRDDMVNANLTAQGINKRVGMIRQIWRWFVAQGWISGHVVTEIESLSALRAGRPVSVDGRMKTPPSTEKVEPANAADVDAACAELPATITDMIQLQLLTGMRPGEVCGLNAAEIDQSSEGIWIYTPGRHKTEHHGSTRTIFLGPKAIAIMKKYIVDPDDRTPLLNPRRAWGERQARRVSLYIPPENANGDYRNAASYKKRVRKGRGGTTFSVASYRRAITRACKDAGVPSWSPNQLRHNAATYLREQFGLEVAQAVLGHEKLETSQVYAAKLLKMAREAMGSVG